MRIRLMALVGVFSTTAAWGQGVGERSPLIPGAGKPRSMIQTPISGGVLERLDIELPPGRRGFQPRIALAYSSLGGLADSGFGWSLHPGKIERSTKKGVPSFTGSDLFVFSVGGGGSELTPVGGGRYRAVEESEYRDFEFIGGDHWEMRDAAGTTYRFGTTAASRTANATWMMDAAEDTNGNTVTFSYTNDGGLLYLSEARYTGHAPSGDPGVDYVSFEYETRPDTRVSYILAARQDRAKRLSRISVHAGADLVRRYQVLYDTSAANGRSLVTGVDMVGSDDATSVPVRRYTYQPRTLGWNSGSIGSPGLDFNDADGKDLGTRLVDVNGDNRADLVLNGASVRLGDGSGGFTHNANWSASAAATTVTFVNSDGVDTGGRILDVNGDLRPDLVFATEDRHDVYINDGSGWVHTPSWGTSLNSVAAAGSAPRIYFEPDCTPASEADEGEPNCNDQIAFALPFSVVRPNGDSSGAFFGDVNGDGLVDIVWYMRSTDTLFAFDPGTGTSIGYVPILVQSVLLNNGSGWTRSASWSAALSSVLTPFVVDAKIQAYDLLDVNADGIIDFVHAMGTDRQVYLNTGVGWTNDATYTASLVATSIVSIDADKPQGTLPADLNGDGLPDYIRADEGVRIAYRNTGAGWVEDAALTANLTALSVTLADVDGKPQGYVLGDVNADGLLDLVRGHDGTRSIRAATGPNSDLLTGATTLLGETTAVTWGVSSQFDNDGGDSVEDLPAVLPVALSLARGDGRGHTFTSTSSYEGGRFDQDGGYRGFALADVTDSRGIIERVRQIQTGVLAGKVTSLEVVEGTTIRSRRSMTYATATPTAGVTQVTLIQTDDETFDAAAATHTRTRMEYDALLNMTTVHKDGDVAVAGDEARTVLGYAVNAAEGITGLPSRISIYDSGGTLVSETVILYDGQPEGMVLVGNATSTIDSIEIGGATSTRHAVYDAYGNPVRTSDRQGSEAVFVFDSVRHGYRVSGTDPAGRQLQTEYDTRWGAVTRDVDANGHATVREYDLFGRVTRETQPGDECSPNGTVTVVYSPIGDATAQNLVVKATEAPGRPDTFDTTSYFDGFGQVYSLASEGDGGRTVRVDTEYDDAGNARSVTRPYFAGDPPPITTFERDALRRSVRTTDPDGIPHTISYAGSRSVVTDKRGNRVDLDYDAYRHVVQVTQHEGGSDLVTRYAYDSFGRPVEVTNALGEVTSIGYDAMGRRTYVDDPALGLTEYEIDAAGKLTRQTDAAGRSTDFTYNVNSELVRKDLSTGEVIEFFYDGPAGTNSTGRVARINDAAGDIQLRYDPRGHIIERRRTVGGETYVTGYHYDSMNRLRQVDYPDGFRVFHHYGEAGYVNRITGSDGRTIVESVAYDAAGRITELRFGNGVDSAYAYDAAERLATTRTANADGGVLQDLGYAYDQVGNVTAIVDAAFNRSQEFEYDELNRLTRAVGGYGEEVYHYDAIGNLLRRGNLLMAVDPDHQQRVVCGLDLSVLTGPGYANGIVNNPHFFTCADLIADPDSGHSPDERAAVGVVRSRGVWHNRHIGQSFTVEYDELGNIVGKNGQTFVYDAENHLLQIVEPNGQVAEENVYDSNGLRVLQRTQGNQERLFIDDMFEMDQSHASRHVRIGRMLVATSIVPRAQVELIAHAAEDGLTVCEGGVPPVDGWCSGALGPPSSRTPLGLPLAALMLFALARLIWRTGRRSGRALRPVAREIARHPIVTALAMILAGATAVQTTWGQVARAAPPPASRAEHRYFYHADHVGSTNVVTDERGAEIERREYRPFGEQSVRTGSEGGPQLLEISFNGQRFDDASGMYYFQARHYDPVLGRFLTADTQIPDPNNPQALHRYAFNSNNPIRYADPTGHGFLDILLAIVLVILVIVAIVLICTGYGAPAGSFLAAVAVGGLIGLAAGVVVGLIVAIILVATGAVTNPAQFISIVAGFAIIGFLVGCAIGAVVAGGLAAAATVAVKLGTATLIGAAGGAVGGAVNAAVNGNVTGFWSSVLIGAGVGAVVGFVSGLSGLGSAALGAAAAPSTGIIGTLATIGGGLVGAGFAGYAGYEAAEFCRTRSCSPIDQVGSTSFGTAGAADALGPTGALHDFLSDSRGVPHWTFLGTLVHRLLAYDVEGRRDLRNLFNVYPMVP
jgi:RHS repeat-associated protein